MVKEPPRAKLKAFTARPRCSGHRRRGAKLVTAKGEQPDTPALTFPASLRSAHARTLAPDQDDPTPTDLT
jgi:hypothetical protein